MPSIAVIGASSRREKFGNKCVRAYQRLRWTVYPVNPREDSIEGLAVFRRFSDIGQTVDRVALYLPPPAVLAVLDDIASTGQRPQVFFNPGTESPEGFDHAQTLGLEAIPACVIVWEGERPD